MNEINYPALGEEKLSALVEVMLLSAHADGEFSDEERTHFAGQVATLTGNTVGGRELAKTIATIEGRIKSEGREARLDAVKHVLTDANERKAAFRLAVRVVAADGVLRTSERELLLDIAEALSLDRDQAADTVKELAG